MKEFNGNLFEIEKEHFCENGEPPCDILIATHPEPDSNTLEGLSQLLFLLTQFKAPLIGGFNSELDPFTIHLRLSYAYEEDQDFNITISPAGASNTLQ